MYWCMDLYFWNDLAVVGLRTLLNNLYFYINYKCLTGHKNGVYEKLNKRKIEAYNRFNRACMAESHKKVQVLVSTKYVPHSVS